MDNRNLKISEIEALRRRAVEAVVKHGESQRKVSKLFGFSQTSLTKYIRDYKSKGESSLIYQKRGVKPGTYSKLSEEQFTLIKNTVTTKTPDEVGMTYTLWTSKVICEYIQKVFQIKYAERSMRDVMKKLGFSSQKPIARAYKRDPEKISRWLEQEYPKIKILASQEGARIYWADGMGINSTDNRGRTYSPRGITPAIKNSGTRFKCNMFAAISPQGFMNWMVFSDNFTAQHFINFLGRLNRQIKQKIFLVLDNHKVHHSGLVQNYVNSNQDKINLFFLPPYCPELNPEELVNQDVKANANNYKPVKTAADLATNVRYYLTKVQANRFKIRNYFNQRDVVYTLN